MVENLEKLSQLLVERRTKLENTSNFSENFNNFSRQLTEVVTEINKELEKKTGEGLWLFIENPYERTLSRFFVMAQLVSPNIRARSFILDNYENTPLIKFEGDEFLAKVKSTISFGTKLNKVEEYYARELTDKNKVFEIMFNFLATITNL